MADRTAVEQAMDLLTTRLNQIGHVRAALNVEEETIKEALTRLSTVYSPHNGTATSNEDWPSGHSTPAVVSMPQTGTKPSVRAAVKHILDSSPRGFTTMEVRARIPEEIFGDKPQSKRGDVVRTALWSLRNKGEARVAEDGSTMSTKWPETTEGPSAPTEEPSAESQQEGGGSVDHLVHLYSQDHDHV